MRDPVRDPVPEDFGLTAEQVAGTSLPFVAAHRAGLFAGGYAIVLATVFAILWLTTSSAAAAAFFAVVIVAAGSILLIPLLICILCASENAEHRRLCDKAPQLAACVTFRRALEAARARRQPTVDLLPTSSWNRLSGPERRRQLLARLEGGGVETRSSPDSDRSGWDLVVVGGGHRVVLRCWAGRGEVPASTAREMIACLADGLGDQAWVVTASEAGSGFLEAVGHHPVAVVSPDAVRSRLLGA